MGVLRPACSRNDLHGSTPQQYVTCAAIRRAEAAKYFIYYMRGIAYVTHCRVQWCLINCLKRENDIHVSSSHQYDNFSAIRLRETEKYI